MWCSVVFPRNRFEASPDAVDVLSVSQAGRRVIRLLFVTACLALPGCSADITRFDSSFGLGADSSVSPAPSPRPIASGSANGLSSEPSLAPSGNSAYIPPRAARPAADVKMSALSEPVPQSELRRPLPPAAPVREIPTPPAVASAPAVAAKGEIVEIQQGDTLYGLSKKHKVSISELMTVNDLKSPALKPGQKLHLPAGKRVAANGPQRPLARSEPLSPTPQAGRSTAVSTAVPANGGTSWQGTYTIKSGDSLYAIAKQNKIQLAELQAANGIVDARKVKPGTVIRVPGAGSQASASVSAPPANASAVASAAQDSATQMAGPQPTILNAPRVASIGDTPLSTTVPSAIGPASTPEPTVQVKPVSVASTTPAPSSAKSGAKLRWPVKGKVIAGFGPRADGTHNDGVNLSVPLGSEVHAAEAGTVAYAGSELKGYGNLILIRHDNGWVTAYAHNDQLLVKRGDKIQRGQVVAKAGKTGTVDQPQVHFELREGSKPIDPTPYMEKL